MITGIDLFAGAGGTTMGAKMAGVNIVWAANHNKTAVDYHAINHPNTEHVCQDLHQADWGMVPAHDIVFASPCCQGHSRAAGKKKQTKSADLSRSTAWAVVSCLEVNRTDFAVIENVSDFLNWELYEPWVLSLNKLGYSLSINHVNAAELGVPQNRRRLFIIASRSKKPIELNIDIQPLVSARTIVDLNKNNYEWTFVSDRVEATRRRVKNGQKQFGDIFLDAAYGTEKGGRSLDKPLGTVTTVNKHSLVIGNMIRALTVKELALAQTFPSSYQWPKQKTITKKMIGNAVPPLMAKQITKALLKSA